MGESDIFGLPGVFQTISDHEKSGTLQVQKDDGEIYICFKRGVIQMTSFPHRRSVLAEALIRRSDLSKEQVEKIFAKQRETKKTLLATVQDIDFPDSKIKDLKFIAQICHGQASEDLYEIFSWPNMRCSFMENQIPETFDQDLLALGLEINPGGVVMEAARRQDEWGIIRQILPSNKDVPYVVHQEADAAWADREKKLLKENEDLSKELIGTVLGIVNGIRDFDELLDLAHISNFKAMKLFSKLAEFKRIKLKGAEDLKQMANLDILRKDIHKCIRLYERVEELGLRNFDTITWLAKAYETSGMTSKAGEKYRELGNAATEQHLYEDAVRAYNKVVEFTPEDLESYKRLLNAYKMLPGSHNMRDRGAEIAAIYARKVAVMDKRNAIGILDEANKNFRSTPANLELMATLYQQMGDRGNAISTYNLLANLMKKQKDFEKTLDAYHKILAIDPTNIKAHLEIAKGLVELGRPEGVSQYKELGTLLSEHLKSGTTSAEDICTTLIQVCETIIQFEAQNIQAREWLVDSYIFRKEKNTAITILRELLTLLQKEQNLPGLVSNLQKITQMDPEDFASRKLLADTLQRMQQKNSAIQEYMQLGLMTYERNDMRRSREAFDAIVTQLDPFNLVARQKRAEIFSNLNLRAKAVEEYRLVGYLCKAVGQIPEAIQAFAKMVEHSPEKELSGILEVARLCDIQKQQKQAITYYKMYAGENLKRGNYGEVHFACSRILLLDTHDVEAMKLTKLAESKLGILKGYLHTS